MKDITSKEDIVVFVDSFYTLVRKDVVIGPVFNAAIPDDAWPIHLNRMYSFWNTVLFSQQDYRGNPFSKHKDFPLEKRHFDRWLALLADALDDQFSGPKTDEVKWRAGQMAIVFESKIKYLREHPDKDIIV